MYRSAKVAGQQAPYDSLTLKVYYPCRFTDSAAERSSGQVPADANRAPFPIVILLPEENTPQDCYGWIANELAQAGLVAVTYSWIYEDRNGQVQTGPGQQRKRLARKRFGRKPSCPALPIVFAELKRMNRKGPLASYLNLSSVVLGGHGVGGRMALLNANHDWFPAVCGVFSYGGHLVAEPDQGWDKDAAIPVAPDMPLLLMGGTEDGILAADMPGSGDQPETWAIQHSFKHGIKGKRGDRHLVLVDGASHFTFAAPRDRTSGRSFLDRRTKGRGKALRKYLAQLVVTFCDQTSCGDPMSTADLKALTDSRHDMVAHSDHK